MEVLKTVKAALTLGDLAILTACGGSAIKIPDATPTQTPIEILSPAFTNTKFLTVTYPIGGERLMVGQVVKVAWATNLDAGNCTIQTIDHARSGVKITRDDISVTDRSVQWVVDMGSRITPTEYKIFMLCFDANNRFNTNLQPVSNGQSTYMAESVNYFTITN